MSSDHVEIEMVINAETVEYAHGLALRYQAARKQSFADTGWRAALARDPKLLKALEKGAEVVDKLTDQQHGRTIRSVNATHGETKGTTEAQLWREAYRLCDEGRPIRNFEWVYGSAAWLCGYNV